MDDAAPLDFFADESIPRQLVKLVEVFDQTNKIIHLTDCMQSGTPDKEWMQTISAWTPKPIVLSGDGQILRKQHERLMLRDCDLHFVVLSQGWVNLPWEDQAWKMIKVWSAILREVRRARKATIFEITQHLKVENRGFVSDVPSRMR
jgi:hypothetical protein